MATIHPTAVIDPEARIGENVEIGPFCVIGPKTAIGDGTVLAPHVVIEGFTTLGRNCRVSPGAVLGGLPQDLGFKGEDTFVEIGDNVVIRECVTINRATGEGKATQVGDGAFIMAYSHLAHNCILGREVILANNVQMAGYVEIGDYSFISGTTVIHQFVKIGRMTIMAGFSGTRQDLPPFAMCNGRPATVVGINKIGLRRRGFSSEDRMVLRKAFNLIWFSNHNTSQGVEQVRREIGPHPLVDELIAFIESSKRGIRRPDEAGDTIETMAGEPEPVA